LAKFRHGIVEKLRMFPNFGYIKNSHISKIFRFQILGSPVRIKLIS
jgi:hypothetical protein